MFTCFSELAIAHRMLPVALRKEIALRVRRNVKKFSTHEVQNVG